MWHKFKQYWGQNSSNKIVVVISVALTLFLTVSIIGGYTGSYYFSWVGVDDYTPPAGLSAQAARGKTLWDWLDLLIVPAVLVIGGYLLNRAQRQSEQDIADKVRNQEREIAKDREEERALQSYLDAMTELLLKENLRASEEDSEARTIARSRTLTVLRGLNETRKASVLQFLYEAKLINKDILVVGLQRAYLQGAYLREADLREADLQGADLQRADLNGADLNGANVQRANLQGAYLNGANLRGADLQGADLPRAYLLFADLQGADLRRVDLHNANLGMANLQEANLYGVNLYGAILGMARLQRANLQGANLQEANLREADLREANLQGADLREADLREADLREADLQGAYLNGANLQGANLQGANLTNVRYNTMPHKYQPEITHQPTQWPEGFDPIAAGAIDVSNQEDENTKAGDKVG